MLKVLFPVVFLTSGLAHAQAGVQSSPATAQLVKGAHGLMNSYLKAMASNDMRGMANLYHDGAQITYTRLYPDGSERALKMTGAQVKAVMLAAKNTEAPDRYSNVTYTVLEKGMVRISAQRQSVSRGYTAPNHLFVQADAQGRWWIVGEQGFQRVK